MTAQDIVDVMTEGRLTDWISDTTEFVKDATGIGRDEFGLVKNKEKGWKPKYTAEPHKKYRPVRRAPPQPAQPVRQTTWQDE